MTPAGTHPPRRRGNPVLVLLALLTLAGCGQARSGRTPTKAFTAQADAICRYERQKLRRAAAIERAPIAAFQIVPRLVREAVVLHEAATTRLESLPAPRGGGAQVRTWLTARTVASTLRRDAAEAPPGQYPAARSDLERALAGAAALELRLSRGLGLQVCGAGE